MEAVLRDPFEGIGKPELLEHLGGNVWSRRINQAHRLAYEVFEDRVEFPQAGHHCRPRPGGLTRCRSAAGGTDVSQYEFATAGAAPSAAWAR
jgi:toxin YoeB